MNFRILFLSLFSVLFLTFSTASAQQSPEEFVVSLMEQAKGISNLEGWIQEDALLYLVRHNFDISMVGKFVLGRYWRRATLEQKQEFLDVFELAAVRSFSPLIKDIPLDTFKIVRVEYDHITNILVYTTIKPKDQIIKIRWRLRLAYNPSGYKIIDITAEGVSLIVTLRSEYTSYIKNHSLDELIVKLRKRGEE